MFRYIYIYIYIYICTTCIFACPNVTKLIGGNGGSLFLPRLCMLLVYSQVGRTFFTQRNKKERLIRRWDVVCCSLLDNLTLSVEGTV